MADNKKKINDVEKAEILTEVLYGAKKKLINDELKERFEFHIYGNIHLSTINYLRKKKILNTSLVLKPFISFKNISINSW